jgi:hypothetical protein
MRLTASKDEDSGLWNIPQLEHWEDTLNGMVDNLKINKPFKFARYGDGEIYCMKGKVGQNCDNHVYYPQLGNRLRQAINQEPDYMVGIQPLSVSHLPQDVENYFSHFTRLYNADVLHNASMDGQLSKFTGALLGHYIVLVGPPHLADYFKECVHIVIPSENCWTEYENVRQQIDFHVDGINNAVVLLASSMMSEVLIDDFSDYHHTFVDVGSVLDPYCGVNSRRYHHKLKI